MAFADSNRTLIRIIEETVWGVTPASGKTQEVRLTSSSLSATKETVVSDELRADRMVSGITEVSAASSGDINFEYSAGSQDEFWAAFLMSSWSQPSNGQYFWKGNVSVASATTVELAGIDATPYITTGRSYRMDGFTIGANNAYVNVSAVSYAAGVTTVTVTGGKAVEAASQYTRFIEASDIVTLNSTAISAATTGFSSSVGTQWQSAIAANKLVVGQKIAVTGLGHATGSVTFTALPTVSSLQFNDGDALTPPLVLTAGVDYVIGGTVTTSASNLAKKINDLRNQGLTKYRARATAGVVTLSLINTVNGTINPLVVDANVTAVDPTGAVGAARGLYTITSLADNFIGVTPNCGIVAAGDTVNIRACYVKNPSSPSDIAQRKFSIETSYTDIGQHMLQTGMVPGTISLDLSTGAIVTGTVGFQGRSTSLSGTTILGTSPYTPVPSNSTEVMNCTTNVGNLSKNGVAFNAAIQSLSLSGEASLRQQSAIASKFAKGIGAGRLVITGSMSAYFEDATLYNHFLNHDTVALSFTFTDPVGYTYVFTLPAVKFDQDQISPGGIDQDIMDNVEFSAFRDAATGCMLQIDRLSPYTPL